MISAFRDILYLRRLLPLGKPFPPILYLEVTSQCNSRCRTCYNWKKITEKPSNLSLEQIEKICTSIGQPMMHIVLTGGEPFLRQDLPELVGVMVKHLEPESISICTNGSMPTRIKDMTKKLLKAHQGLLTIGLSFDGVGEEHDAIRGLPGSYKALVRTYKTLEPLAREHSRIKLAANTVLCQQTLPHLERLHSTLKENFPLIRTHIVSPLFGEPWDNNIKPITAEQMEEAYPLLREIALRGHRYPLNRPPHIIRGFVLAAKLTFNTLWFKALRQERDHFYPCKAGRIMAHIDCYGWLHTCVDSRRAVELAEYDFDVMRAWRSGEFRGHLQVISKQGCECSTSGTDTINTFFYPRAYPLLLWDALHSLWNK